MSSPMPEKRTEPWAVFQECAHDDEGGEAALEALASGMPAVFANSTLVGCRRASLPFYRAHELLELEIDRGSGGTDRVFVLDGADQVFWLNGESTPMHDVNDNESLELTETTVVDYVRYFMYFLRADAGAFVLIESADEVASADDATADDEALQGARSHARPLVVHGTDGSGRWLVDSTVAHGGTLFSAPLAVDPDGEVEMLDDEPIGLLDGLVVPSAPSLALEELKTAPPSDRAATTEPTALEAAAAQMAELKPQWQKVIDHIWNAASQMLEGMAAAHPDLSKVLAELDAVRSELVDTFRERIGHDTAAWADNAREGLTTPSSDVWLSEARGLINQLRTESVPWGQRRRDAWTLRFDQAVGLQMTTYEMVSRQVAVDAWLWTRTAGTDNARVVNRSARKNVPEYFMPAPPIGPCSAPVDPGQLGLIGPGPLNVYLGDLGPGSMSFSTTSYGGYESHAEQFELPQLGIPVVIDLDAVGAFLVNERRSIEEAVLNLLTALPANQFLLKVFDPEHGGDSAKFLYGLGEVGERIVGQIRTSDRELAELLQATEEHITLVTQRFLKGEHKSLTEYNRAAPEVAEAYQLLVLYDFPSGFERAGRFDEDKLEALSRIIKNGSRAGVFTILVSTRETLEAALQPADQQDDNAAIKNVFNSVPWFFGGEPPTEWVLSLLSDDPGGLNIWTTVDPPAVTGAVATVTGGELSWTFVSAAPPSDAVAASQLVAIKNNIASASDVQVTPEKVAKVADAAQRSESTDRGEPFTPTVAYPDRPDTWWRASSAHQVAAHFGIIGARQVADLILGSDVNSYSALIGGQSGSGKSVLIHSVIMSIATEYPPSEVELYLIDFKEGVEFQKYADIPLPHARLIAIQSERDFGLSVLESVSGEIERRAQIFKETEGNPSDLKTYRATTGQPLKRIVLIIDEFQQLFSRDDTIAAGSAAVVKDILLRGRAFGIHLVLATQSLAGMAGLGRNVMDQIPTRIALRNNESDSRLILAEDNPDADSLTRAGEGILNRDNGHRNANQRFQATLWDDKQREQVLREVVERARAEGCPQITTLFKGYEPAYVNQIDARSLIPAVDAGFSGVAIPVGLPVTLDPGPLFVRLRRQAGSNLLVVDEHAAGAVAVAVASLNRQGASIDVFDFVGDDDHWIGLRDQLRSLPNLNVYPRRTMVTALSALATEVDQRQERNDYKNQVRVLVIAGMGLARDFNPDDSFDEEKPSRILGRILRDGPEVGVFVVAWFDVAAGVKKRLETAQLGEFGHRLLAQAGRDDSLNLIGSDSAAGLKPGQGVLADVDRSTEQKVRTLAVPDAESLAKFIADLGTG